METPEDEKIQSHGITKGQMKDLQYQQQQGDVKMIDANNVGDNIKDKEFAKEFADYQLPEAEKDHYHVVAEARLFNQTTGEKISNPVVHKYTKEAFEFNKKHHGFDGQTVHILHNPTKTVAEKETEDDFDVMTVAQLKEAYKEITGEDAPKNIRRDDLLEKVKEAANVERKDNNDPLTLTPKTPGLNPRESN